MDEAASKLRIEIDSMPTELDVVIRRLRQLDIERMALENETDAASKERLAALEEEYAELKEESDQLAARWQAEKQAITKIQNAKQEYEDRRAEAERLERQGDLAGAAALRYGTLPELERTIDVATRELDELQASGAFLKEEVDAEDIADVVSRWTGIPVSKLMEGEVDKLVRMEDLLHSRVVGQDEAVTRRGERHSTLALGTLGPESTDRVVSLPRPHRRRQRRNWLERWPSFSSTTNTP